MRNYSKRRSLSNRSAVAVCGLLAAGLMYLSPAVSEAGAARHGGDARTQAVLQVAARSDYTKTEEHAERRDALVLSTHVRRASNARPYSVGVLVEYSLVDAGPDTLLVGGMFTRKAAKWTAAASPFYKKTLRTDKGQWYYWGSLRRQISERHSLGIEAFGSIETHKPSKWLLGYTGTISKSVSVSIAAGSGFGNGPDRVARGSVVWRPRGTRR
jgi:hypothetical protein